MAVKRQFNGLQFGQNLSDVTVKITELQAVKVAKLQEQLFSATSPLLSNCEVILTVDATDFLWQSKGSLKGYNLVKTRVT